MMIEDSWVPARIDRETADFPKIKWPKKSLKWPKIDFLKVAPHFFHFPPYSNARTDFILCTLLSNVRNMASPKMCPCPKLAHFGPNSDFSLGNPIFANRAFVVRGDHFCPWTHHIISLRFWVTNIWAHKFFWKSLSHCGTLSVVNSPCVHTRAG